MKWNKNNEAVRLNALKSYELLDTLPEKTYDDITGLAAAICNTEISLITLVSDTRQFFKSHHGIAFNQTPIEASFCRHMILEDTDELTVEDAKNDLRFKDNQMVLSDPRISFYGGVSLNTSAGMRLGALCVMDSQTKQLTGHQQQALYTLAQQIVHLFEFRKISKQHKDQKETLTKKESILNTIIESAKIGIWEWEKESDLLKLSEKAANIAGYEATELKELTKKEWQKLIHPDDLEAIKEKFDNTISTTRDVFGFSYRIIHKKGHFIWVHETGKVTRWSDTHKPLTVQGTISDITAQVNHDQELEKLTKNQGALINSTKDLLWSVDTNCKFIIANTAFKQIMKKKLKRKIRRGETALPKELGQEHNTKWKSYYKRALKGDRFTIKEKIKDPEKPWATYGLVSLNPIYNKKGTLLGVSCFSKDITSEFLAQQVILSAKEETDKIMNTSLDIICTIDEEGYFLTINKACIRIWGYTPEELIGRKFMDFLYPEDIKPTLEILQKVISGKTFPYHENRYIHKDKHLVPIIWSATWDADEGILYAIATDITEKKKVEQQLELSERRFKTLVQEGTELIAIFDQESTFTYVSPTSKKTLKMSPEELMGTKAFDHIHPDDHEVVYAQFLDALKSPQVYIKPFRFKNGEGDWRWLETIATNQIEEPSIKGIVVNTWDVTDRILHIQAIEAQNNALKEVAWNQSHIIRAPVARLMGLINLMKSEGLEEAERTDILDFIISSAEEIDTVIKKNVEQTVAVVTKGNEE